jgi:hypothetical protein
MSQIELDGRAELFLSKIKKQIELSSDAIEPNKEE